MAPPNSTIRRWHLKMKIIYRTALREPALGIFAPLPLAKNNTRPTGYKSRSRGHRQLASKFPCPLERSQLQSKIRCQGGRSPLYSTPRLTKYYPPAAEAETLTKKVRDVMTFLEQPWQIITSGLHSRNLRSQHRDDTAGKPE
jgi:hypothetical protein